MDKYDLIEKAKYMLHEVTQLEKITKKVCESLENDYVDKAIAIDFNYSICFIRDDGMNLINEICDRYQKYWEECL